MFYLEINHNCKSGLFMNQINICNKHILFNMLVINVKIYYLTPLGSAVSSLLGGNKKSMLLYLQVVTVTYSYISSSR